MLGKSSRALWPIGRISDGYQHAPALLQRSMMECESCNQRQTFTDSICQAEGIGGGFRRCLSKVAGFPAYQTHRAFERSTLRLLSKGKRGSEAKEYTVVEVKDTFWERVCASGIFISHISKESFKAESEPVVVA